MTTQSYLYNQADDLQVPAASLMMSLEDIQLLVRAARAAGVEHDDSFARPHPVSGAFFGLWLKIKCEPYEGQRRYWNPLVSEQDAFRLALDLNMGFEIDHGQSLVRAGDGDQEARTIHYDEHDPHGAYAAARRAITLAAADLAR